MTVKTINLEAVVHQAVTAIDDMPIDPDVFDALIMRFDAIIPVMPYNAYEAYQTGLMACLEVSDYARELESAGRGDRAYDLDCVIRNFRTNLDIWYAHAHRTEQAGRKDWDCGTVIGVCIARWESRGGRYWVELWRGRYEYHYVSDNGGGSVCRPDAPVEGAVVVMQSMLDRGRFQPDCAKLPMKRVN